MFNGVDPEEFTFDQSLSDAIKRSHEIIKRDIEIQKLKSASSYLHSNQLGGNIFGLNQFESPISGSRDRPRQNPISSLYQNQNPETLPQIDYEILTKKVIEALLSNDNFVNNMTAKVIPQLYGAVPELNKADLQSLSESTQANLDANKRDIENFKVILNNWEISLDKKWNMLSTDVQEQIHNQNISIDNFGSQLCAFSNLSKNAIDISRNVRDELERFRKDLYSTVSQINTLKQEVENISFKLDKTKINFKSIFDSRPSIDASKSSTTASGASINSRLEESGDSAQIVEKKIEAVKKDYTENLFMASSRFGNLETCNTNFRNELGFESREERERISKTVEKTKEEWKQIPIEDLLKVKKGH